MQEKIILTVKEAKNLRPDAKLILGSVLDISKTDLALLDPNQKIPNQQTETFMFLLEQRKLGQPLGYIIGSQEFYSRNFLVSPKVLLPRIETEKIIDIILDFSNQNLVFDQTTSVIDVGTGCGNIGITAYLELKKNFKNIKLTLTDISEEALEVAKSNCQNYDVPAEILVSDLLDKVPRDKIFKIVTANLPYVAESWQDELTEEVKKQPSIALFGGNDGLVIYRNFFQQIVNFIDKNSIVLIESDPWQQPKLIEIAKNNGLILDKQDYFISTFKLK